MDKEKITAFLEDMIDALTFKRVALLCLLASVMITMITLFENRDTVFAKMYKTADAETAVIWDLSDTSKTELTNLTNSSDLVGAALVTDVDLKKNRRTTKWYTVKDAQLAESIKLPISRLLPQPLFDYDPKNTEQMVSMLNNEFRCVPTKDTVLVRFFPELIVKYPHICRIAVPPFFGEFAGYLSVLLAKTPTQNELDGLKIEMNRISIELYLRDIAKSSHH